MVPNFIENGNTNKCPECFTSLDSEQIHELFRGNGIYCESCGAFINPPTQISKEFQPKYSQSISPDEPANSQSSDFISENSVASPIKNLMKVVAIPVLIIERNTKQKAMQQQFYEIRRLNRKIYHHYLRRQKIAYNSIKSELKYQFLKQTQLNQRSYGTSFNPPQHGIENIDRLQEEIEFVSDQNKIRYQKAVEILKMEYQSCRKQAKTHFKRDRQQNRRNFNAAQRRLAKAYNYGQQRGQTSLPAYKDYEPIYYNFDSEKAVLQLEQFLPEFRSFSPQIENFPQSKNFRIAESEMEFTPHFDVQKPPLTPMKKNPQKDSNRQEIQSEVPSKKQTINSSIPEEISPSPPNMKRTPKITTPNPPNTASSTNIPNKTPVHNLNHIIPQRMSSQKVEVLDKESDRKDVSPNNATLEDRINNLRDLLANEENLSEKTLEVDIENQKQEKSDPNPKSNTRQKSAELDF